MTSTNAPAALVPGVTASAWARVGTFAFYFTTPVYLVFAYLRLRQFDTETFNEWFIPAAIYGGVVFAVIVVAGIFFKRSANREAAAGYTTQWRSHPTLPQLEAGTGVIIRRAGEPYVKRSEWRARALAGGSNPIPAADESPWSNARPNPWGAVLTLLPALLVSTIAFANLIALIGPKSESYGLRLLTAAVLVAAILLSIVAIAAAVTGRRVKRLEEAAPGDLVFVFAKSKGYSDGYVSAAMRMPGENGYIARGASADSTGLTVWEGNPFVQAFRLPWDSVTSIQVDTVPGGNQSNNMVLVTFRTEGDELATLPLAYPKLSAFPLPSKAGVRWIVARLNELREGKSVPRVL